MPRSFYVYERHGIFHAELFDPVTRARIASRSTHQRTRDEAILVVGEWLKNGLPTPAGARRAVAEETTVAGALRVVREAPLTSADALRIVGELRARGLIDIDARASRGPAAEPFAEWLQNFWKWESPYIQERLAHGQRATKRHCQDMEGRAREIGTILPEGLPLGEVKRSNLAALGLTLRSKGLAPATVNKTLSAATTALRWAAANELIPVDPTQGLRGFSGQARRRGILEPAEVKALFSATWEDERARVACLVSATTGARLGEVLAIQHQDIGEDRLYVRHSYSIRDGLKCPKNGETREVPLLPAVRSAILALEAKSPHPAGPERFVFAGRYAEKPLDENRILLGMRKALVSMNGALWDDESKREKILAEYRERGIDFHSWRHWYAKNMADRLDAQAVQRATGHKTAAMLEHYADHKTEADMARLGVAAGEAFADLLPEPHGDSP